LVCERSNILNRRRRVTNVFEPDKYLNPLQHGNLIHDSLKLTSALSALSADVICSSRIGLNVANQAATYSERILPHMAYHLAPKLGDAFKYLKTAMNGQNFARAVALANFAAAIDSLWNGIVSYRQGNMGEAAGHGMIAAGSTVLGVGSLMYAVDAATLGTDTATATAAASASMLTVLSIIGLLLVIAGAVVVVYFHKSDFEVLLENCFWGSGDRYLFWQDEDLNEGSRPVYNNRMQKSLDLEKSSIQSSYQLELQEFMNYLYMPQLVLEKESAFFAGADDSKTYRYTFTLPGFKLGVSELHYRIEAQEISPNAYYYRGNTNKQWQSAPELTDAFQQALNHAEFTENQGASEITMTFTTTKTIRIYWYYEPQPSVISPRRYLTANGLITHPITGFTDEALV
jgi:hypothetical protein